MDDELELIKNLSLILPEIRNSTTLDPDEFCPYLREQFSNCGIALVFLPHIGGSFLHGATFLDGKNRSWCYCSGKRRRQILVQLIP